LLHYLPVLGDEDISVTGSVPDENV